MHGNPSICDELNDVLAKDMEQLPYHGGKLPSFIQTGMIKPR
jgi:hypothetical protein